MDPETKAVRVPEQPAGQPVATPATEPAQVTQAQSAGLTIEAVGKLFDERLEKFQQREQANRNRMENRLRQEVERQVKTLAAAGIQVTDEQRQALTQATAQQIATEAPLPQENPPVQAGQPVTGSEPGDATTRELNTWADKQVQTANMDVEETDPEAELIDFASPDKFKATFQAALAAKTARVNRPDAAARLPTIGAGATPGNPIAHITDPTELFKIGFAKKG